MQSALAYSAPRAELIMEQPWLFKQLYRFNLAPADWMHVSHRPRFFPAAADSAVWSETRARAQLSVHVLRELKLEQDQCFDPQLSAWPILLLDADRLERLLGHVASALLAPRVRRALARAEVLRWKAWLGPDLHQFALTGSSLLPLPAYDPPGLADAGDNPHALGYACLLSLLGELPQGLVKRLELKLPAHIQAPEIRLEHAKSLVWVVLAALEKKWCSSFATSRA